MAAAETTVPMSDGCRFAHQEDGTIIITLNETQTVANIRLPVNSSVPELVDVAADEVQVSSQLRTIVIGEEPTQPQQHQVTAAAEQPQATVTTGTLADVLNRGNKKQKDEYSIPRLPEKDYSMPCEWGDCHATSEGMIAATKHVTDHIADYIRSGGPHTVPNGICFTCSWRECGAQIVGKLIDYTRHVYFHVFHIKLKCIGEHLTQLLGLGVCTLGSQSSNWIPEMPNNLQCAWGNCKVVFDNPIIFYYHVGAHSEEFGEGQRVRCQCKWKDCKVQMVSRHRLKKHLRVHTQEKAAACSVCGGLFSSHTKLVDHIVRQGQKEGLLYECSHCNRRFSTERMLREHMRRHVNHYKCPLCAMTCSTPSTLRHHVRYRHSDERPYQCGHCNFSAKTSVDLSKHLDSHNIEDRFSCHVDGCSYTSRSFDSLTKHFNKKHGEEGPPTEDNEETQRAELEAANKEKARREGERRRKDKGDAHYMCHICNKKFCRGFPLTQHLKKIHLFQWPPGHSRFKYKLFPDGFYRLQTTRYEYVEVMDSEGDKTNSTDEPSALRKPRRQLVQTFVQPAAPPEGEEPGQAKKKQRSRRKKKKSDEDGDETQNKAAENAAAGEGASMEDGNDQSGEDVYAVDREANYEAHIPNSGSDTNQANIVHDFESTPAASPKKGKKRQRGKKKDLITDETVEIVEKPAGKGKKKAANSRKKAGKTNVNDDDDGGEIGLDNVAPQNNVPKKKQTKKAAARRGGKASSKQPVSAVEHDDSSHYSIHTDDSDSSTHYEATSPHSDAEETLQPPNKKQKRGEKTPVVRKKGVGQKQRLTVRIPQPKKRLSNAAEQSKEKEKETSQKKRPAFRRSGSLDECPPEMVELPWQEADGQSGSEMDSDEESVFSGSLYTPGSLETEAANSQPSTFSHTSNNTMFSPSSQSSCNSPQFQSIGLRVEEYKDTAEANLHMLGDVALRAKKARARDRKAR